MKRLIIGKNHCINVECVGHVRYVPKHHQCYSVQGECQLLKCNIDRSTSLDEQFVCMPSGSYFVSLLLNIDYSSR